MADKKTKANAKAKDQVKTDGHLPPIPAKEYFSIGEAGELCAVKPHVLRYWEAEFPQLKPVKRRGNRRYYRRQDVLLARQIRTLLYDEGYTISGARQKMTTPDDLPPPGVNPAEIKALIRDLESLIARL